MTNIGGWESDTRKIRTIHEANVANLLLIVDQVFPGPLSGSIALARPPGILFGSLPIGMAPLRLLLTAGRDALSPSEVKIEIAIAIVVSGFIFFSSA
jgi:hypothetical protein